MSAKKRPSKSKAKPETATTNPPEATTDETLETSKPGWPPKTQG